MFSRSCALHTIARNACNFEYTVYVISKHMCMNIMFYQCGRRISSRLKYSRNALYINVLSFARYFRQRFAPFIRHRRRSQGYPYEFVTFTKFVFKYIVSYYKWKKSKIPKTFLFLSHSCQYWCGIIKSQRKGTANIVPIKQCISFFIWYIFLSPK